ncbi:hypothetical protein H2204_012228 [Knufia peltigerae]|uniref:Uncharacterized protein n=1 Tax=Knufia peltigerae TaxID=1002370 RepID=A0AA38XTR0_9EURO|nr:hypothetical protein H2204_012228 [Knufia peltigerae]
MANTTSTATTSSYSVPAESERLLLHALLDNPKIKKDIPHEALQFASRVVFTGSDLPSIAVNWRFAESVASLKALEACMIAALVKRKYDVDLSGANINVDHAQLFFMSALVWTIDHADTTIGRGQNMDKLEDVGIPNYDFHRMWSNPYRTCATNIYRTEDDRFFHLHGGMNPKPTFDCLGLPEDRPDLETFEESVQPCIQKVANMSSAELQHLITDVYKQAGVVVETVDSFRETEQGKANADVGLFELYRVNTVPAHRPGHWWQSTTRTSSTRPLAGLKVVDLTRVIAGPAVTRGLAELGASVMRVTSPNVVDFSELHVDLSWGKWSCSLDLETEEGRDKLRTLIRDADVVVQGYRPGVLDKYGFSQDQMIDLVRDRPERGIISVRENCYGWHGPWSQRSGWQQISDACTGMSAGFGRAMGLSNDEPVTPVFPNSDYMTGIVGAIGVLSALIQKADRGGSYKLDLALNYYNQWLTGWVGEYPEPIWNEVWHRNGRQVFRSCHNMNYTIPRYMKMMKENTNLFDKAEFFENRESKALGGVTVRTVRPVIRFVDSEVQLKYNVGTRGNGRDAPRWPDDLMTEVVL